MPEKTRIAFISDRLDGKSHKEIAEELGISVKGVEYHISKAVKLLRDNLKEYAPFLIFLFDDLENIFFSSFLITAKSCISH